MLLEDELTLVSQFPNGKEEPIDWVSHVRNSIYIPGRGLLRNFDPGAIKPPASTPEKSALKRALSQGEKNQCLAQICRLLLLLHG